MKNVFMVILYFIERVYVYGLGVDVELSKNIHFKRVFKLKLRKLKWKIIYPNKFCIL